MSYYLNFSNMGESGKLPRKGLQLQGPRPAALKVCKDSCKVKKPAAAPTHGARVQQNRPLPCSAQPPPPPVIIYMASPKIIHTEPGNFMELVQRLTGASPTSSFATAAPLQVQPSAAASPSRRPIQRAPADEFPEDVENDDYNFLLDLLGTTTGVTANDWSSRSLALLPTSSTSFPRVSDDPASLAFHHATSLVSHHEGNWNSISNLINPSPCWNPNGHYNW